MFIYKASSKRRGKWETEALMLSGLKWKQRVGEKEMIMAKVLVVEERGEGEYKTC